MIRGINFDDLKEVAQCHKKSFPTSLSSSMGIEYLKRMLSWYLDSPNGFIFSDFSDMGEVKGYLGGIIVNGNLPYGSASSMAQHSFDAAVLAFLKKPWLIFHKEMFRKYRFVLRNIWYRIFPQRVRATRSNGEFIPHTGLVVIGVDPAFQGQGIGQSLLSEFERRTIELGIGQMKLTVHSENEKAIGAYKKSGWTILSQSGKSVAMQKQLN